MSCGPVGDPLVVSLFFSVGGRLFLIIRLDRLFILLFCIELGSSVFIACNEMLLLWVLLFNVDRVLAFSRLFR